jgi:hypothetical protein
MPIPLEREALQDDLAFVESQIAEHPDPYDTIRVMWENRKQALLEELAALDQRHDSRGRVALIFKGHPVTGSQEIRLDFATKALENYQGIVGIIAAERAGAELGARGRVPGAFTSKLFIKDMLRGSVGFLLEEEEPVQRELVPSSLKQAIEETTKILDDLAGASVERFEERIQTMSPRALLAVKRLTKVLYDFGAETEVVDDEHRFSIDQGQTTSLQTRLAEVDLQERFEDREGTLLGLFPERQQYEFRPADGASVSYGPVSPLLDAKYVADTEFARSILLKPIVASFRIIAKVRAERIEREEWVLEDVRPARALGR